MTKQRNDYSDIQQAITPASQAVGPVTGTKINSKGFQRARFIFNVGANSGTSAALSTGFGIWKASTSGATFAQVSNASGAAVTSGVLSGNVIIIDVPTDSANPWLLVSNLSILSTAIVLGATVELYNGINNPPTHSAQQIITA